MNLISTIKSLFNYLTLYMGGGGSSAPTQQNVTQTSIPEYARPYVETALGKTAALTDINQNPYQPYQGQQVADLSQLQQQAMNSIGGQQVASQLGDATNLAYNVGQRGFNAGDAYRQQATSAEAMGQYMSPYMQNVVDVQSQEARRQADISRQSQKSQAVGQGAFGGSRSAIVQSEADRNLATQLGQIQAQGSQNAFQQAQQAQQFGANLGLQGINAAGSAASTLGALGQTQFGQQMGINQAQMQAGALQQAQQQRGLDVAFQQYQDQLNYPYKQLAFQSDMFRGLPLSQSATTMYQNTGAMAPQLLGAGIAAYGASTRAKNGGIVKGYAEGGITTVDPSVPSSIGPQALSSRLAKLSDEQLMAYARTVKDAVALAEVKGEIQRRQEAREPQGQMPSGTVAQSMMPQEAPEMPVMAGGGIVALSGGGMSEWGEGVAKAIKERDERNERSRALGPLTDITGPIGFLTSPGSERRVAEATLAELRNAPMEDIRAYRDTGAIPRSADPLGDPSAVANMAAVQAREAERRAEQERIREQGRLAQQRTADNQVQSSAPPGTGHYYAFNPSEFDTDRVPFEMQEMQDADSQVQPTGVSPNAPPGTVPGGIVPSQAPAGQAPPASTGSTGIVPSSKAPAAMAGGAIPVANPGDPMSWGAYKANVDDMAKLDPEQKAVIDDMRKRSERKMSRAEKQEKNVMSETTVAMGLAMMGGLNLSDGVRRMAEFGGRKYFESSAAASKAIEAADDAQGAFDQYQLSLKQGNKKVAAEMYGKFHSSMMDYQGKIQAASMTAGASREATAEAAKGRVQYQANILADRQLARDQQQQQFDMQIQQQSQQFKLNLERQQDTARLNQFEQLDRTYGTTMSNRDKAEAAIIAEFKPKLERFAYIDPAKMSEADKRQLNLVNAQLKEAKLTKLSKWDEQLNEIQNRKATMMGIRPIGGGSGTAGAGGNIPTYDPATGKFK